MTDNTENSVDMDNLETFSKDFFNTETDEQDVVDEDLDEVEEEVEENEDDSLATEDDEDVEEEIEEEPQPKKRNRTQERIEQLVTEARVAERERDAERREREMFQREYERLKAVVEEKTEEKVPIKDQLADDAPKPDAVDENGEPLYPLGEFDRQFIADLTRFTMTKELEAIKQKEAMEAQQQEIAAQQQALSASWNEKLAKTEEELPDIREKIATMATAFEGIDPAYGNYLAGTIMSCDYGPEIMYYLSQNIGEAQKIVASGPAAATLAIGRLEAQFLNETNKEEARRNTKRVSDASPPPDVRARGTGGKFTVRGDTRDLAAFRREFYKK